MGNSEERNTSADQNTDILEDDPVMEPESEEGSKGRLDDSEKPAASSGEAAETEVSEVSAEPGECEDKVQEEKEILKLREELESLNDRHLRLHAEFENYKKRMAQDRENLRKHANEGIMGDLLTVIDHLEMAVKHAEGSAADDLLQGVQMTLKEFETLLERHGVKSVTAKGKPFDPNLHHAMNQVVTDEVEENSVVEEFRKGYMLHDKLIRPALVSVAKAPEKETGEPVGGGETGENEQQAEPPAENG